MKNINKVLALALVGFSSAMNACKEPFDQDPNLGTSTSDYKANFAFVNAIPDAPALNFYVNNLQIGTTLDAQDAQAGYTQASITSNGVFANTGIRAKASTGTIGGVLNKADLIYRGSNTGTTNFQAVNNGFYTIIALDSINRPVPKRTLDAQNFGAVTYYSTVTQFTAPKKAGDGDTTILLSNASDNSVVLFNLVKKYNNNVNPPFLIPIGIVPLGSSDVGGPRFLVLTDALVSPTTGKFAVRFVNASPDAGAVTAKVNSVNVAAGATYPMLQANFNPSVGSRSATVAFTNNFADAGTYNIDITGTGLSVSRNDYVFEAGGNYTIVLSGSHASSFSIDVVKNK